MRQVYSRQAAQIKACLSILACALPSTKVIYISTPITNGKILLPWLSSLPDHVKSDSQTYEKLLLEHVIKPNIEKGQAFAARVRDLSRAPVIDPSPFMADDWTQTDYIELWTCVIEEYASEVWFNSGWEFSNGCTQEYLAALKAGIPTKDASGNPLPASHACALIEGVIPELQEAKVNAMVLRSVLSSIKAFITNTGS